MDASIATSRSTRTRVTSTSPPQAPASWPPRCSTRLTPSTPGYSFGGLLPFHCRGSSVRSSRRCQVTSTRSPTPIALNPKKSTEAHPPLARLAPRPLGSVSRVPRLIAGPPRPLGAARLRPPQGGSSLWGVALSCRRHTLRCPTPGHWDTLRTRCARSSGYRML
jgi:hypothetical protein